MTDRIEAVLAALPKATKGPWTPYIGEEIHGVLDAQGRHLAECWLRKDYDSKANAILLAAAPEMAAEIIRLRAEIARRA